MSVSISDTAHVRTLVTGTTITLTFRADTITAYAGCNTLSGTASLDVDRLVVGPLATTLIGCEQPLAEQDRWLAEFLTNRPTLTVAGPTLTLRGATVAITLADRTVVDPARALAGTHWVVDTIIDAGTASSVPPHITADLTLGTDGRFTGNTGCRPFSGSYTATATTITFTALTIGKRACTTDTVDLDRAVLAALTGTATYHIDAGRLTLTVASGAGLGLTAH